MKERINVAELLKDCPKGMELDCTMFEGVTFNSIVSQHPCYPIKLNLKSGETRLLTTYGCFNHDESAKCVIFPKGETTWEGFQRPFKDGDIVTWKDGSLLVACIYKERKNSATFNHHIALYKGGLGIIVNGEIASTDDKLRFATEEEKEKLFQAIKDNGYHWNAETKTLEKLIKPKFKIGDRIVCKNGITKPFTISKVGDNCYYVNDKNAIGIISLSEQDNYELVPNKFDINTLKPFESRVLVRDTTKCRWYPEFFGCLCDSNDCPYMVVGGNRWKYCIPFEGNEHLMGSFDDCDEYYKTWE